MDEKCVKIKQKTARQIGGGYLFQEVDGVLQVHTKIDEGPFDTFTFVLFLLKNEHVVVEELLQLLVGEVDAKLLETVELRFGCSFVRERWSQKGLVTR
jgi:redox-regulated HSP33 family molecular chaperone